MTTDSESVPSTDTIRAAVAGLLGISPDRIGDDTNLAQLGLKSLQLMQLVNLWRRQGITVSFRELARRPTVEAWHLTLCAAHPSIHKH